MAMNGPLRAVIADDIRQRPDEYECFIGLSLAEPEARAFLESHGNASIIEPVLCRRRAVEAHAVLRRACDRRQCPSIVTSWTQSPEYL